MPVRMQSCPLNAFQERKRRQGPALVILGEGSRGQTRGAQQLGLDLHAASRKVRGKELSVLFPPGRPCAPLISCGHRHTLSSLHPTILSGKMYRYRQHEVVHTYTQHLAYSSGTVHMGAPGLLCPCYLWISLQTQDCFPLTEKPWWEGILGLGVKHQVLVMSPLMTCYVV